MSISNEGLCEELYRHLSEFLDRDMTEELQTRFDAHLEGCISCRSLCRTMRGTVDMVRDLGATAVPHDCLARLRSRVLRDAGPTGI